MAALATALFADGFRNGSPLEILFGWLTYAAVLIHAAAQVRTSALAFWICITLIFLPVAVGLGLPFFFVQAVRE
jgi:hypothetical protein